MANEIMYDGPGPGRTTYALIRNRTGQIWNTSGGTGAFESFNISFYSDYGISATEQGGSNFYTANMPSAIPAGVYSISAHQQLAGSPAQTDPHIAAGDLQWNGSVTMPLSDTATSGQVGQIAPIRMARGVMVQNFPFKMVSSLDHVTPFTSGVCSGQILRDNGAFTALQSGSAVELGLGFYRVTLTSGDLLCNTAALSISAVGISGGTADNRDFAFVMQRVSGSV